MIDSASSVSAAAINRAAEIIRGGGIVAFPTETFYGLAADPFNPEALRRLFDLKGRSHDKPILVLIDGLSRLSLLTKGTPGLYTSLIKEFWPGPLTLIFAGSGNLPELLTDSHGTVGIRWSSHPLATRLTAASGGVITGTSANPSGLPGAVSAEQVRDFFRTGIDFVLDGGPAPGGLGSTIVSIREHHLMPVREGVVPFASILAVGRGG
ncbi:MAG: threonylcarbamoyl-AMP synthase [Proteobacteria bacterium]|nr:threonylcarbamoyl-AMP synthase [Pseudomonadota bacterium]MBU1736605.1 threonylcarbamoyl-AMP synthase [Pseudomonadota bacterium]